MNQDIMARVCPQFHALRSVGRTMPAVFFSYDYGIEECPDFDSTAADALAVPKVQI
jgi:hypothetical protein